MATTTTRVFKVEGRIGNRQGQATVRIDFARDTALVSVRPFRSRKVYTLTLANVADMVCWKAASIEASLKRGA
jgi:hypothetical protein